MERHALVTGGTRGIGYGVARVLGASGYRVTVTGLTEDEVAAFEPARQIVARLLDVTNEAMIQELFGDIDRLDALVNCAGIILRGGAEFDMGGFKTVLDVNLSGTMRMCLAAKSFLAGSGGCIVNTASMLSFLGGPMVPAYAASKGGVVQLTKSLAAAWADDGIRVNAVAPGWVATELTRPLNEDSTRSQTILERTPMGRWGEPEDIGGAVAFLCSEQATFITGAVLPVDGGYLTI